MENFRLNTIMPGGIHKINMFYQNEESVLIERL